MFVDLVEIEVKAGNGGNGIISFHRLKNVAKGGPNGGDGGRGGDVIFEVDENLMTLMDLKYHRRYKAERGADGLGGEKSGKSGESVVVRVPPGTAIFDVEDKDTLLCDLITHKQQFLAAKGGRGGLGNVHFKSATNQAPRKATSGKLGDSSKLLIELRLIGDVGLVGYPNAGKSTILAAVSEAKPKIASYPFTTLSPNIGVVNLGNFDSFRMADLPGIIEGASRGKGLGLDFLRHIMRTRVLLFVIDATDDNPVDSLGLLQKELAEFDWTLNDREYVIALNKTDLMDAEEINQLLETLGANCLPTSGMTGEGIDRLKQALGEKLNLND